MTQFRFEKVTLKFQNPNATMADYPNMREFKVGPKGGAVYVTLTHKAADKGGYIVVQVIPAKDSDPVQTTVIDASAFISMDGVSLPLEADNEDL